jgi:tRNA:m4X modification enzyme
MNDSKNEKDGNPGFKRLKRKLSDTVSYNDLLDGWTQCCFLLKHKGRLCNVGRVTNSLYCGNHITQEKEKEDLRIPCPLDPSHTVYAPKLQNHLKICNAEKKKQFFEAQSFYKVDCNKGTGILPESDESIAYDNTPELFVRDLLLKINLMFEKVTLCSLKKNHEKTIEDQSDPVALNIRNILGKKQTSFKHWKHIEQDICIVKRLLSNTLLSVVSESHELTNSIPIQKVYVEYGAGKGLLGQSINITDPTAALLFVERSGNRKKVDKFLADRKCAFQRFKLDIKDCFLPKLPFIQDLTARISPTKPQVTIVAKHLCGVATDLAIRSLSHFRSEDCAMLSRGLAIATCCHHACVYEDYVGHEVFLKDYNVNKEEFNTMKFWSGWATLDVETLRRRKEVTEHKQTSEVKEEDKATKEGEEEEEEEEEIEHNLPSSELNKYKEIIEKLLTYEEMVVFGGKIKRILDYGRMLFLERNLNLSSKLEQYCEESFSPECFMLIAIEK